MFIKLKTKLWLFVLFALVVIVSQIIILKPHLEYGFSDVDWGFLSIYKTQNPYSLSQFIENFKQGGTRGGVYTHQIYYIGIQEGVFGLNYEAFQTTSHFFRILAILGTIPLFLIISGNLLITFLSTLLLAFAAPAVGTMYTVVTSSDYSAIFSAEILFFVYWYAVKNNSRNSLILILLFFLLVLTLFLSTERMYPLLLFIGIIELFIFFRKKSFEKKSFPRILTIFVPPVIIFLLKPTIFLDFLLSHGVEIIQRVLAGNWNLLLTPFIVLGSLILPHNYTKYFGIANIDSFIDYLTFIVSGPIIVLFLTTLVIGLLIFKESFKFICSIFLLTIVSISVLYILASHFKDHSISVESISQALVGFYIISFAMVSFIYWVKFKERLVIGLFAGPFFALLYIVLTWIGASTTEIFSGIHRYQTIPALFMSLFLGNLFTLIIMKVISFPGKFKIFRTLVFIPLILLLIFININAKAINVFFNGQLKNGFGANDKNLMRNQLLAYLNNISTEKPSLIYFDFTEDSENGYYYDNALLSGLGSWILWYPRINFNEKLTPYVFFNDLQVLKNSVSEKEGKRGFIYKGKFFELDNFYAFKLKDKKVIDIKEELLLGLGI